MFALASSCSSSSSSSSSTSSWCCSSTLVSLSCDPALTASASNNSACDMISSLILGRLMSFSHGLDPPEQAKCATMVGCRACAATSTEKKNFSNWRGQTKPVHNQSLGGEARRKEEKNKYRVF